MVTQCTKDELTKQRAKQRHMPLAVLGVELKGSSLNRATFEMEVFAIFPSSRKLEYILLGHGFVPVFIDHRNLLFLIAPIALEPALGRHVVSKARLWALFLSKLDYVSEQRCVTTNIFLVIRLSAPKSLQDGHEATTMIRSRSAASCLNKRNKLRRQLTAYLGLT